MCFTHPNVANRLRHVTGLADTLTATTARLKMDGDMNPLLTNILHAHSSTRPLGDVTASTHASVSFSGDTASCSSDPSKDGWFDPGERKKHRDSRLTIDHSQPSSSPAANSLRVQRSLLMELELCFDLSQCLWLGTARRTRPNPFEITSPE